VTTCHADMSQVSRSQSHCMQNIAARRRFPLPIDAWNLYTIIFCARAVIA
jgi:hypothetical protein